MITAVSTRNGQSAVGRLRRAGARAGFMIEADASAVEAPASGDVAAITLGPMLALPDNEAQPASDREARRHGHAVLDALAALQQDLLCCGAVGLQLGRLHELARIDLRASDPRLRDVLAAVVLRANVELARFDDASVTVPG